MTIDRNRSHMRIALLVVGLAVSVVAAVARPAGATVNLSAVPTYFSSAPDCLPWWGQMSSNLNVDGANLYTGWVETQRIYVRFALYSVTTGQWKVDTGYFYGDATGYDSDWTPQLDHVQFWTYSTTGRVFSNDDMPFRWNINQPGTYRSAFQLAWDASQASGRTGAPASKGWTNWVVQPGSCTF